MSARLLRGLIRLLGALASVAFIALGALFVLTLWLTNTEAGLQFALGRAVDLLHGQLTIASSRGRLLHDFELRELRYHDVASGTAVAIARVHLRLSPLALLDGRVQVRVLEVDQVALTPGHSPPSPPSPTPVRLPTWLPLDVVLERVSLNGLVLNDPAHPDAEPLRIDSALLRGRWTGDRITVSELRLQSPLTGPLHLQASLRSGGDRLQVDRLELDGPGKLTVSGQAGLPPTASDLQLNWRGLHWPWQNDQPQRIEDLDGQARFRGAPDAYRLTLHGEGKVAAHPLRLQGELAGDRSSLRIAALQVQALDAQGIAHGSVQAQGELAWAPALHGTLAIDLAHLDPALFGAAVSGDLNGRLDTTTTTVDGQPQVAFTARLDLATLAGKTLSLTATGTADAKQARLARLALQAGGGQVEATGAVAWSPTLAPQLTAHLVHLDPALLSPQWPGDLNGQLKVDTGADRALRLSLRIDRSRLRGKPVQLIAQAGLHGQTLDIATLRFDAGSSHLSASGTATPPFDLHGQLDSPDLAELLPGLSGRATGTFTLAGPLDQPHLVTRGEVGGLRYRSTRVDRLRWQGDLAPQLDSRLTLTADDLQAGGQAVREVSLALTGREAYHHAELRIDADTGQVRVVLDGGYDRQRGEWGGALSTLSLSPKGLPAWSLEHGAGLLIGPTRRALEPACLQGEGGHLCVHLEQNVLAHGTRVGWDIDRLTLETFAPLLPAGLRLSGTAEGKGQLDFNGTDLAVAQGQLNLHDTRIAAGDGTPLHLDTASLDANQQQGRLQGTLKLATGASRILADLTVDPGPTLADRPLTGTVEIEVPDLAQLDPVMVPVRQLGGRLQGRFAMAGRVGAPRLDGSLTLDDGQARLVAAGIDLTHTQLKLTSHGGAPLSLSGQTESGGGTLSLSGTLDPFAQPLRVALAAQGQDFQALDINEARAWISPDLTFALDGNGARLDGTLTVPRAEITPEGLGGGGVSASADQVLVGVEQPKPSPPLPVTAALKLVLGQRVSIQGFGLKTRIEGAVDVTQTPGHEALGRGELRLVDGHYKAYGQDLKIETGRLIFSGGEVTTPAVDLYATRHPRDDITVGVRVRGTLAKPELSLDSTPSMPREQQLSWLVLGRSLETSSTQDRSAVQSAALGLGLGGGDFVANIIGKHIGLDEVSVGAAPAGGSEVVANSQSIAGAQTASAQSASAQSAQLTLGKYLTPRLFVSYGVGLFQPGYTFRLLYTLGHGFKLSTESGTASGGDLLYTTERGKPKLASKPASAKADQAKPPPSP